MNVRAPFRWVVEKGKQLLEAVREKNDLTDYRAWRHQFLLGRLRLILWLGIIGYATFFLLHLSTVALLEAMGTPHLSEMQTQLWHHFMESIAVESCLVACLLLQRSRFGWQHPEASFLGFSWAIALLPQIQATLRGEAMLDIVGFTLVFLTQAVLAPVRWWLHFISQSVVLIYFFGINTLLGLSDPIVNNNPFDRAFWILYFFWFCFICDLGVYLYERLQRSEFESRRQLEVFLHGVSHDLRNPVTGLLLVLRHLHSHPADPVPVSQAILKRLLEGSDRQLGLIESLREAHTSELRGIVLHRQPTCLYALVQSAIADLEPLLDLHQATLKNQIQPDLPAVDVDAMQIWRVFSNLIVNAIKHNPPGLLLTLHATVLKQNAKERGEPPRTTIRCCVEDNGVGIDPDQCDRLFDLYFHAPRHRNGSVGLGLGLYLCRKIITAHGGDIDVISSPSSGGAMFCFTLPTAVREMES